MFHGINVIRYLFYLLLLLPTVWTRLECIQCDRASMGWYSDDEMDRHAELCQHGRVPPTPCRNHTHTQCIVSWFRSSDSKAITVTERRCGMPEDATGCTLYNPKINRKVRHLISRDTGSKREPQNLFVEVCSEACPGGECVSAAGRTVATAAMMLALLIIL